MSFVAKFYYLIYIIFVLFKGQKPFTQVLAFTKAASNSCITTSLLRCLVTEKTKTMKQQTTAVWVFQTQCIRFIIFLNFIKKIKTFSQKLNYSRLKLILLKKFIILFKLEQCVLILGNEESEGKPQIIQGVIWTIYLIVSILHIFFQAPKRV